MKIVAMGPVQTDEKIFFFHRDDCQTAARVIVGRMLKIVETCHRVPFNLYPSSGTTAASVTLLFVPPTFYSNVADEHGEEKSTEIR